MIKKLSVLIAAVICLSLSGCGNPASKVNPKGIPESAVNVLADSRFLSGGKILGTDTKSHGRHVRGYMDFGETVSREDIVWEFTQWASKESLAVIDGGVCEYTQSGGVHTYANTAKSVIFDTVENKVVLSADTGYEYDWKPRTNPNAHVHLLMEQYVKDASLIGQSKEIYAYIDFEVNKSDWLLQEEQYDQGQAAQFLWYFMLTHRTNSSARVWLGIPLYDSREERSGESGGEYFNFDKGTHTYIYSLDKTLYLGEDAVTTGKRYTAVIPLKAHIEYAVNLLKQTESLKDVFANTETADFKLDYMNAGWEIPGTFDVAGTFYGIGLYEDRILTEQTE